MTYRFDNQTVVVTGGTGELGQHLTSILHGLGARLIIPFISEQEMQVYSIRFPAVMQGTRFVYLDAKDGVKVRRTIDQLVESEGVPHGLVNLIGGYKAGPPIVESELDELYKMLDLNLAPTFHFCRSVVPHMLRAGRGHIVSVGARMGLAGSANHAAYSIAKSAIIRFTEALSDEVKHHNVNVNCVLPSIIDTARNRREMPAADYSHWVTPTDLAHVIAFLLSEGSKAVHGAAIPVYGRV